jgi:predicted ATPase/DNA-binding winged helix-turn-helix (wHTH) protein
MKRPGKGMTLTGDATVLYFGPYRLEGAKRLWRGEYLLEVRPRPLAVLRYLAERPGRLITGEELLKRLWPGIYVTKTVLRVCVHELRQALHEDLATPQFVETVGRQGYRFIAPLATTPPPVIGYSLSVVSSDTEETKPTQRGTEHWQLTTHFVGREQELARLQAAVARAQQGERQIVFLLGEAGVGKTTVIDCFLQHLGGNEPVWIGRGQCMEHHGSKEAYLPILEILGQWCREPGGKQVVAALRRYAPLWLAHLPGMEERSKGDTRPYSLQGDNQGRMLWELAEALEALAADSIVIMVLEDVHWSDPATIEAIAYVAQRRRPVRLCLIGVYRPAEVVMQEHPLRRVVQELVGRRQCEEIVLELFTAAEVKAYLAQRLGPSPRLPTLSELIYHRTDGNALFTVNFVDYLLEKGLLTVSGEGVELCVDGATLQELVPGTLQQLIVRQIESLDEDEQELLAVASVSGPTFTAVEVAETTERTVEAVERICDTLASGGRLIEEAGISEWPDGTVAARYAFRHTLYQQVLSEQLGQARRMRIHRHIGEWKEERYGDLATEIAGELAIHFTEGRDYRRAVQYHCQAGETALRCSVYAEVLAHCKQGLNLLERWPETLERQRQERALRKLFSAAITATRGYGMEKLVQNGFVKLGRKRPSVSSG